MCKGILARQTFHFVFQEAKCKIQRSKAISVNYCLFSENIKFFAVVRQLNQFTFPHRKRRFYGNECKPIDELICTFMLPFLPV